MSDKDVLVFKDADDARLSKLYEHLTGSSNTKRIVVSERAISSIQEHGIKNQSPWVTLIGLLGGVSPLRRKSDDLPLARVSIVCYCQVECAGYPF